jgi:hypothetical protein
MTSSVLMEGLARHTTSPTKINRFGERASNQKQLPQRPAGAYACVGPERAAFAPHACDTSRCTGFFEANGEIHSGNGENDHKLNSFRLEHVCYSIFFTP